MKLKEFLARSGRSLAEFAETVGVSEVSMGRYAAGKRVPRPAILRRIVAASGGAVEANDFFAADVAAPGQPALDADVAAIDMLICDMCGIARGKRLARVSFDKLFTDGVAMPASTYALDVTGDNVDPSGVGMSDGDPDGVCRPVAGTLAPVPWAERPTAQVLASMYGVDGQPVYLDPRHVLARVAARFGALGLRPVMAHELEFYLLDRERDGEGRPRLAASPITGRRPTGPQVYSLDDVDDAADVIDAITAACAAQSIPASGAIAEYAPGQYEVNLAHQADPLAAADHAMLLKRAVKGVARARGLDATFMAKPFAALSGNGLHLHLSLIDGNGDNIFDETRDGGDERLGHAIGGLRATMAESMAIFCPNANSYRRLQPEAYAPMTTAWGFDNRTVALRIPSGRGPARRIEHRNAGADANPYLVAAAMLAGVHHGLTHRLDPGPPTVGNAYDQHPPTLPAHWLDSLRAFDAAEVLPDYLGADYCRVYSACKWQELAAFNARITATEYEWYLRYL